MRFAQRTWQKSSLVLGAGLCICGLLVGCTAGTSISKKDGRKGEGHVKGEVEAYIHMPGGMKAGYKAKGEIAVKAGEQSNTKFEAQVVPGVAKGADYEK